MENWDLKPGQLVLVEWDDATLEDEQPPHEGLTTCLTPGWVHSKTTEKSLVLAREQSPKAPTEDVYRFFFRIPVKMIRQAYRLHRRKVKG